MQIQPFNKGFNVAVQTIANRLFPTGFDVSKDAPSTLQELNEHIAKTGRMLVSSEFSDHTVFACNETNYAFRAWHDWCHWKGQFPFTYLGELDAYEMQVSHLHERYGATNSDGSINRQVMEWEILMDAEVCGQALYFEQHKEFPTDQREFVKNYMYRPNYAVLRKY